MQKVKTPAQADQVSEIVAADADSGRLESSTNADGVVAEWIEPTEMVVYVNIEHQRLQLAVVETAKAWKACDNDDEAQKWGNHYKVMCEAIDVLITFEAEQKNGNT